MSVTVSVIDNGQPKYSATPPVRDNFTFTVGDILSTTFGGDLTGGNVKVR